VQVKKVARMQAGKLLISVILVEGVSYISFPAYRTD
jgi:hypothetical protein